MIKHRIPRIKDSLQFLKQSGYDIKYILDIGVHTGTPWLQFSFPKAHHVLIEPDVNHNDEIHENYKKYSYELINVALGNQIKENIDLNLVHEGKAFGYTSKITTLDSLDITPRWRGGNSLVKIDVDGYELDIIRGGVATCCQFDLMIVEAQLPYMGELISDIEHIGFKLWDIVNMDYEHGALHQVDLVFRKQDFIMSQVGEYPDYDFFRQGSEYHESN